MPTLAERLDRLPEPQVKLCPACNKPVIYPNGLYYKGKYTHKECIKAKRSLYALLGAVK